jgi:hypothetical protein
MEHLFPKSEADAFVQLAEKLHAQVIQLEDSVGFKFYLDKKFHFLHPDFYVLQGNFKGISYQLGYRRYKISNNIPSTVILTLHHPLKLDFSIRLVTTSDKIDKTLHLVQEIQTGDSSFNEKYFIETRQKESTRAFLKDSQKHSKIEDLFNRFGLREISFSPEGISGTIEWLADIPIDPNLLEFPPPSLPYKIPENIPFELKDTVEKMARARQLIPKRLSVPFVSEFAAQLASLAEIKLSEEQQGF